MQIATHLNPFVPARVLNIGPLFGAQRRRGIVFLPRSRRLKKIKADWTDDEDARLIIQPDWHSVHKGKEEEKALNKNKEEV